MSAAERRRILQSRGQRERGVLSVTWVCEQFLGVDTDWNIKPVHLRKFERAAGRRCVCGGNCVCGVV